MGQVIETRDDQHAKQVAAALTSKAGTVDPLVGAPFRTVTGQNGRVAFEVDDGFDPGDLDGGEAAAKDAQHPEKDVPAPRPRKAAKKTARKAAPDTE